MLGLMGAHIYLKNEVDSLKSDQPVIWLKQGDLHSTLYKSDPIL